MTGEKFQKLLDPAIPIMVSPRWQQKQSDFGGPRFHALFSSRSSGGGAGLFFFRSFLRYASVQCE